MKCPKCDGNIRTIASCNVNWNEVYRKKECQVCGHRFYTAEFEVTENPRFKKEWKMFYKNHKHYQ